MNLNKFRSVGFSLFNRKPPKTILDHHTEHVNIVAEIRKKNPLKMEISQEHYDIMVQTLRLYADPDTYFATFILPDRPAGAINDDWGVHHHPEYEEGDIRPGHAARLALWYIGERKENDDYDPDPDFDFLKVMKLHTSYYDDDYKKEMKKRGVLDDDDLEETPITDD